MELWKYEEEKKTVKKKKKEYKYENHRYLTCCEHGMEFNSGKLIGLNNGWKCHLRHTHYRWVRGRLPEWYSSDKASCKWFSHSAPKSSRSLSKSVPIRDCYFRCGGKKKKIKKKNGCWKPNYVGRVRACIVLPMTVVMADKTPVASFPSEFFPIDWLACATCINVYRAWACPHITVTHVFISNSRLASNVKHGVNNATMIGDVIWEIT